MPPGAEGLGSKEQTGKRRSKPMAVGKGTDIALAQHMLAGVKKHYANVSAMTFGSATFTAAEVEASLQAFIDLRAEVEAAKTLTKAKLMAEQAQGPALRGRIVALMAFVRAAYSNSPDVLADFGLKPRKVAAPATIEEQAEAAAKRRATRAARHTMGKRQKEKVKGTIETIVD